MWFGGRLTLSQIIVLAISIICMEVYHTEMPVWGILVAFGMAIVYIIPVGTVYAVANLNANVLTVLGEIISGYLLPGKPIVMLIFKVRLRTGFHLPAHRTDILPPPVLRLHRPQPSHELLLRYEARSIHEDPQAHPLRRAADGLHPGLSDPKSVFPLTHSPSQPH